MSSSSEEAPENLAFATIGLSDTDLGRIVGDSQLRAELLMAGKLGSEVYGNILASAAFVIQDAKDCGPGMILEDVAGEYIPDSSIRHVLLLYPVFWPAYEPLHINGITVAWLLAVPITEKERQFIHTNGWDAFDQMLEEKNVDVSDLQRKTCI